MLSKISFSPSIIGSITISMEKIIIQPINSNLTNDFTIVVKVRQSILGHTPPTEYRDLNVEVIKSGTTIYSSGWHVAGSGTERKTYNITI